MDQIDKIHAWYSRLEKAEQAFANGQVSWRGSGICVTGSRGDEYIFSVAGRTPGLCSCEDATYRTSALEGWCWHRFAAKLLLKEAVKAA